MVFTRKDCYFQFIHVYVSLQGISDSTSHVSDSTISRCSSYNLGLASDAGMASWEDLSHCEESRWSRVFSWGFSRSNTTDGTTDLVFYICKLPLDAWNLKELLALCRCRRCKWCFCLFTFFGSLSTSIGKWSHITSCFVASNFCTNASRIISKQWHHENVDPALPYSTWSHKQKAENMLIVFGESVFNKTLILSFLEVSESFFPLFRPTVFLWSHKFFPRSYRGTERQQRPIWT